MPTMKTEDKVNSQELELGKDLLIYAGLFSFGIVYNKLVAHMNRKYGQHGYTSFFVVFGVFSTMAMLSTRIGAINTLKIAAGFGVRGYDLGVAKDPDAMLRHAFSETGPCLIHAPIDASEKVFPMVPPGAANKDMIGGEIHEAAKR